MIARQLGTCCSDEARVMVDAVGSQGAPVQATSVPALAADEGVTDPKPEMVPRSGHCRGITVHQGARHQPSASTSSIQSIAEKWVGTPFIPHACVLGVGVDCVHLTASILREAGLLGEIAFPGYRCDSGMHQSDSAVLAWLNLSHEFLRTDGSRIQPYDLLAFRVGRVAHHVGLALSESRFIHAMRSHGVIISSLRDSTYAKRLEATYRPVRAVKEYLTLER